MSHEDDFFADFLPRIEPSDRGLEAASQRIEGLKDAFIKHMTSKHGESMSRVVEACLVAWCSCMSASVAAKSLAFVEGLSSEKLDASLRAHRDSDMNAILYLLSAAKKGNDAVVLETAKFMYLIRDEWETWQAAAETYLGDDDE